MTIEDNKKYKLTGEQIKDIASRFGVLSGEIGDLSSLTTTDKTSAVAAINEIAANAGGITELTADDYNYPTNNPDGVAIWKLDTGIYTHADGVKVYYTSSTDYSQSCLFAVHNNGYQTSCLRVRGAESSMQYFDVNNANGGVREQFYISQPVDNLTSSSEYVPLSAKQGKVLKDFIGDLTNLTTTDKTNLVAAINEAAAGGGGGPTVVQTTGTSQTDVMSQNATTSMVYADPATKTQIQLGNSTSNNLNTVSIGNNITAEGTRAIAIGDRTDDTIVTASGASAISIGVNNSSTGGNGIAIGVRAKAIGDGSIAWGTYATSSGQYALATHYQSEAAGRYSSAIGPYAKALSLSSMAFGTYSQANGARSLAVGERATTDSEGSNNMAIGYYASATGNGSMAVGLRSSSTAPNALALGAYSSATQQGEMNIGTTNTTYGYNNSNYRLLSGLYDPQSDHDAATKGYVDGLVGDIEAALHTINYGESS